MAVSVWRIAALLLAALSAVRGVHGAGVGFNITSTTAAHNPCIGLRSNGVRDDPPATNTTYNGDGVGGKLCVRAADMTTDGIADELSLTGVGFSTMAGAEVTLSVGGVLCVHPDNQPIGSSDTAIMCTLHSTLPLGALVGNLTFSRSGEAESEVVALGSAAWPFNLSAVCPPNAYPASGLTQCLVCPPGGSCPGGLFTPRSLPGYWLTQEAEWAARGISVSQYHVPMFTACPFEAACTGDQTCGVGHEGWACTSCIPQWAPGKNNVCMVCPPSPLNAGIIFIAIVGAAIFAHFLIRRAMKKRSKVVIVARMFVNFLQMTSAMRLYTGLQSTNPAMKQAITLSAAANFISFDITSLRCVFNPTFYERFSMTMSLPPLAVLVPLAGLILYAGVAARIRSLGWEQMAWKKIRRTTGTSAGVLLFFLHNAVGAAVLTVWNCAGQVEGGYLRAQPEISCNSSGHRLLQRVIAPALLALFGFGIPLAGFVALWRRRTLLASRRTLKYYGFGYDGFRHSVFWWECFVMIRKLAFVAVGVLITDTQMQLVCGVGMLILVLSLHLYMLPYQEGFLNALETAALGGNLFLYFGILLHTMAEDRGDGVLQNAMGYMILISNAVVLVFFLFAFALALRQQALQAARAAMRRATGQHLQNKGHMRTLKVVIPTTTSTAMPGTVTLSRAKRAMRHGMLVAAHERNVREQRKLLTLALPVTGEDTSRLREFREFLETQATRKKQRAQIDRAAHATYMKALETAAAGASSRSMGVVESADEGEHQPSSHNTSNHTPGGSGAASVPRSSRPSATDNPLFAPARALRRASKRQSNAGENTTMAPTTRSSIHSGGSGKGALGQGIGIPVQLTGSPSGRVETGLSTGTAAALDLGTATGTLPVPRNRLLSGIQEMGRRSFGGEGTDASESESEQQQQQQQQSTVEGGSHTHGQALTDGLPSWLRGRSGVRTSIVANSMLAPRRQSARLTLRQLSYDCGEVHSIGGQRGMTESLEADGGQEEEIELEDMAAVPGADPAYGDEFGDSESDGGVQTLKFKTGRISVVGLCSATSRSVPRSLESVGAASEAGVELVRMMGRPSLTAVSTHSHGVGTASHTGIGSTGTGGASVGAGQLGGSRMGSRVSSARRMSASGSVAAVAPATSSVDWLRRFSIRDPFNMEGQQAALLAAAGQTSSNRMVSTDSRMPDDGRGGRRHRDHSDSDSGSGSVDEGGSDVHASRDGSSDSGSGSDETAPSQHFGKVVRNPLRRFESKRRVSRMSSTGVSGAGALVGRTPAILTASVPVVRASSRMSTARGPTHASRASHAPTHLSLAFDDTESGLVAVPVTPAAPEPLSPPIGQAAGGVRVPAPRKVSISTRLTNLVSGFLPQAAIPASFWNTPPGLETVEYQNPALQQWGNKRLSVVQGHAGMKVRQLGAGTTGAATGTGIRSATSRPVRHSGPQGATQPGALLPSMRVLSHGSSRHNSSTGRSPWD